MIEKLNALKTLLTPDHWTQGAEARDELGHSCDPTSPEATCWCLYGGLAKVFGSEIDGWVECDTTLETAAQSLFSTNYIKVNDRFGFGAVHAVIDLAIKRASHQDYVASLKDEGRDI